MTRKAAAASAADAQALSVLVFGAGKVGKALAAALRSAGASVQLRQSRVGWPRSTSAPLVLLTCRDSEIAAHAAAFSALALAAPQVVLLHCAGALSVDVLRPAARAGVALGQWHPLLSFSDGAHPPPLAGGHVRVAGDAAAVQSAQQLCTRLGMHAVVGALDPTLYHAAAALLANGTAALMEAAVRTLCEAGVDAQLATRMLLPLLASVLGNLREQGVPQALSGPVRRGAHVTVGRHLEGLSSALPEVRTLYQALARVQLSMAAQLGDASETDLAVLRRLLEDKSG